MTTTLRRTAAALPLFLAGVLATGCGDAEGQRAQDERIDALRSDVDKARKDLDRVNDALKSAREESRALREDLANLGERLAAVEARPAGSGAAAAEGAAVAPKPTAADRKAQAEEMDALLKKVFEGTATDEEEQRFWELARTTGRLDEMIKTLEGKVAESPGDLDARMNLAQAYISKLLTLPSGPEQGLWSGKAVTQWKKVLEAEPEHWEARYSLAFNWSMWPDFLNKTPDAIAEFEKLREIQERGAATDQQADTYFQLSRLYLKQGKRDKAQEVLRTGIARHPTSAHLKKALDSMTE